MSDIRGPHAGPWRLSREVERKEASVSIWEGGVAHSQLETLPNGTQRALPNSLWRFHLDEFRSFELDAFI